MLVYIVPNLSYKNILKYLIYKDAKTDFLQSQL